MSIYAIQFSKKDLVGLKAINLTAENCTQASCDSILEGTYPFVYVVSTHMLSLNHTS